MRNFRGEVEAKTACSIDFMGFDFYVEIFFRFRAGSAEFWDKSRTWLPPDPPTWEVRKLTLALDLPGKLGPAWSPDGEAFAVLAEHPAVLSAIHTYLWT